MKLKIYTMGGTIDKIYFDEKSEFQVGDPQIGELLREANVTFDYEIASVLRKDSLEMTEQDRTLIRDKIIADSSTHFLITHGTDTMIETARALAPLGDKTVVLTGAMQPARLRISDAIFNIGFAIASAQLLSPGIYVAMNGRIFDPLVSKKNVEANRFEGSSIF